MGKHITSLPNEPVQSPIDGSENVNVYAMEECQNILKNMDISSPVVISYKPGKIFEFHCENPRCCVDTFLVPEQLCDYTSLGYEAGYDDVFIMNTCPCPVCHKDSYSTKEVSNDINLMRKMKDVINNIKTK